MGTAKEHSNIPSTAVEFGPGLWRTSLQRYDLSVPGREMIQSRVDIEPDSPAVRHTHPGEEIIYVLAGSLEYQIDGQPTKVYHAGEALTVPAGVIHAVRNTDTSRSSLNQGFRMQSNPEDCNTSRNSIFMPQQLLHAGLTHIRSRSSAA
jgi:quercetin dioxygenase-like cupin family protein